MWLTDVAIKFSVCEGIGDVWANYKVHYLPSLHSEL